MSLLSPQDRTPLLESLRPPADHALHTVIATTFCLDLVAMMMAPVGFTFFELDEENDSVSGQAPLELLEAIRRHAGQMVLFCEAGRIAVPSKHRQLFSYLEGRIVQARAPRDGRSFHPKLWVIRFVGPHGSVRYRLLCLSRNLTFDRSLDSILMLEGQLRTERTKGFAVNAPLREFLAELPSMAVPPIEEGLRDQCAIVEGEISRVDWELGDLPFETFAFCPLGHRSKTSSPFYDDHTRMLVASPFVSDSFLSNLTDDGSGHILISRRDELDALTSKTRAQFKDIHILCAQAESGEESALDTATPDVVSANDLHAKLFIADRGWNATVWTGSANATHAAFDGNVEFLVELTGKKAKVGIDVFLKEQPGGVGMTDLLEPYVATDVPVADAEAEAMDDMLDRLRTDIASESWTVSVTASEETERYTVVAACHGAMPSWPEAVTVQCRLLSLGDETFKQVVSGTSAGVTFDGVSLEGLTAFLAFQLVGQLGEKTRRCEFVVSARLLGEPPNRRDRILQGMLRDKSSVVRFLLMLLAESGEEGDFGLGGAGSSAAGRSMQASESESLLEPLLRTFARDPGRLTAVANLVRDLESTDEGRSLVPDGLAELIEVLQSARGEATL